MADELTRRAAFFGDDDCDVTASVSRRRLTDDSAARVPNRQVDIHRQIPDWTLKKKNPTALMRTLHPVLTMLRCPTEQKTRTRLRQGPGDDCS
jgi:hypothetical protein